MRKLYLTAQITLITFLSLTSLHLNLIATIITQGTSSNFNSSSAIRDRVQVRGEGDAARLELEFQWSNDMSLLTTPPDKRFLAAMAYVPANNSAILFGGSSPSLAPLGDTQQFDVNTRTWSPVTAATRPDNRYGHRMVALDNTRLLLFGGHDGTTVLNDTWIFDSADNSWHELTTLSTAPCARALFAMERAQGANAVVLFGGNDNTAPLSDTWVFNINNSDIYQSSWTLCHPATHPSARDKTCMASNSNGNVYLFGGHNGTNLLNEIWSYNSRDNVWTNQNPSGVAPGVRQDAAMFYDTLNERFVVHSGLGESLVYRDDMWYYYTQTNNWNSSNVTALSSPPARSGHCLVYVPTLSKALLFGGQDASEDYQDTRYFSYRSSGVFTSNYLEPSYYSSSLQWTRLQVETQIQEAGLNISFQFAASDDQQSWSEFYGPGVSTTAWFSGAAIYDIRELSQVLDNHRYIKYRAMFDATGNIPKTPLLDGVTVTYNITPATVTLIAPLHGATTNQSKPAFYWNPATDPDSGDSLTYTIAVVEDNNSFPVFSSSGIPVAVWVSTVSLAHDKWYRWRVRAFDGTVFGGWSGSYALYVDTVAPAAITNLAAEIGSGNGQIKLSWSSPGDNNFSGNIVNGSYQVRCATYPIDNDTIYNLLPVAGQGAINDSPPGYPETRMVTGLDGATTYYAAVKITDRAGNRSMLSTSSQFAFTNAAPRVTLTAPLGGENWAGNQWITWTSEDPNPGDGRTFSIYASSDNGVSFSIGAAAGLSAGTTSYLWDTRYTCNGDMHLIKIIATDTRGLTGESVTAGTLTISNPNEAPSVTVLFPNGGELLSGTTGLLWRTSDNNHTDAHTFSIAISSDGGATYFTVIPVSATFYNLSTVSLSNGPHYRVKITATDDGGLTADDSSDSDFGISNNNLPPRAFSLLYPEDSAILSHLNLDFSWENNGDPNPEDSVSYTLTLSTSADFIPGTATAGIASNSFRLNPSSLSEEATYFWKVTATDSLRLATVCNQPGRTFILRRSRTSSIDGKVQAWFISGLPADGYIKITEVTAATECALQAANDDTVADPHLKILNEKAYRISVCDSSDREIEVASPAITVKYRYDDADGNGYYDGSLVPVNNLRCGFLNDGSQKWEAAPDLPAIDRQARSITNSSNRLGVLTMLAALAPASRISGITNYPNPFAAGRQETRIRYVLTENADTTARIYTLLGDLVWERNYSAGSEGAKGQATGYTNEIRWDGRNGGGNVCSNGMYLFEITGAGEKRIRKIGIVK
ncbi:MAG: hypothetical protein A2314_08460 [Elusimicrobia bacterium RIFOXYB2_FULL_50_12]|nr:MAG: hypothetical protein A2314_08460 [Elusimicrobia bacterium RIFOXYB2_FULL_50_12]